MQRSWWSDKRIQKISLDACCVLVKADMRCFKMRKCSTVLKTPKRTFFTVKENIAFFFLKKKTTARMFLFHRNGKTNDSRLWGYVPLGIRSLQFLHVSEKPCLLQSDSQRSSCPKLKTSILLTVLFVDNVKKCRYKSFLGIKGCERKSLPWWFEKCHSSLLCIISLTRIALPPEEILH